MMLKYDLFGDYTDKHGVSYCRALRSILEVDNSVSNNLHKYKVESGHWN